ncbi:MAG: 5-(carboxyamino)imidazole ribonucleotide synthase [Cytophagales bacterium]
MTKNFYQDFKLGVLGGGQLGRMLIQSCVDFNIFTSILDSDITSPCKEFASQFVIGDPTSFDDVYNFGKNLDLITIEVENVNVEALKKLKSEGKKVYPQPEVIELIQDKRIQKQFYKEKGIPTADFILIDHKEDLKNHIDFLPAMQKLGKSGYDGRGVMKLKNAADIEKGFESPSLLEKLIDFDKEISVITARNEKGEVSVFPVVELVFHPEKNLVEYLFAPASVSEEIVTKANEIALKVTNELGIIGILAVEMFVTKDGQVLVNEIAPRPHNSGHHTIKANYTSQFEQHLRAILNLPLGSTLSNTNSAMVNILGEEGYSGIAKYEGLEELLKMEGVFIHLYGKKFTKPFRKMGHITVVDQNLELLKKKVNTVKSLIKVIA